MKWNQHLRLDPALFKDRLSEATQRALAFALLHFVYGLYLGYSGDFDFNTRLSPGLGIPAALTPALFLAAGAFPVVLAIDLMGQAKAIRRRTFWAILVGTGMAGGLLGAFMLSGALEHNPQGAFYNPTGIAYAALSAIFYSWFLALFLPVTLTVLGLMVLLGLQRRSVDAIRRPEIRQAFANPDAASPLPKERRPNEHLPHEQRPPAYRPALHEPLGGR